MLKQIVEAHSPDSMADAVARAMAQAAVFISEHHDIRVSILELTAIRQGGYRAVLEVTLLPLGQGRAPDIDLDKVAPAKRFKPDGREKPGAKDAALKSRILDQFRRRKSAPVLTAAADRTQLTEAQLVSQLDGEYSQAVPQSGMSLPDPTVITTAHERVDDKVHHTPIDEIIAHEFSHVTHPDEREVVVTRRTLPPRPAINAPHEEPE